jgi:ribose 5-phosphate isomerase B
MYSEEDAISFLKAFLETPFSEGERHIRRIGILSDYEASGVLPPLPT